MSNVIKISDLPEIYCIKVPLPDNPLRDLNSYVVCASKHHLIIDTGFNRAECRKALWRGINELSLDLSKPLFLQRTCFSPKDGWPYMPLWNHDVIDLGNVKLEAIHTPRHTPSTWFSTAGNTSCFLPVTMFSLTLRRTSASGLT